MRSLDELNAKIASILIDIKNEHKIRYEKQLPADRLAEAIAPIYQKSGQPVVVLVDEYDKPILDAVHDTALAAAFRDELKNFYSVLKDADVYLDERKRWSFWFETGTPRFLIKLLMRDRYMIPKMENLRVGEELIDSFDVLIFF